MKETKLTELLKNFSGEELKELEKFVSSPYLNRGRDVSQLLKLLKKFHPDFKDPKLSDEYLISNLFPDKIPEDKRSYSLLKTYTSELFKLCKDFLVYSEFNRDINRKNYYLLNQLRLKKSLREFEKEFESAVEFEKNNEDGNASDFLNKYNLHLAYAEYSAEKSDAEGFYKSIFKMAEYASIFALVKSFRLSELKMVARSFCYFDSGFNIAESLITNINDDDFIRSLNKAENKYYHHIEISYLIHKMTMHPEKQEYYQKLKSTFDKHLDILGHSEKYTILGIMGSYCVRMVNEHNLYKYSEEQFNLYVKSLKLGVYKWAEEDNMHISVYRNIIISAVVHKKTDWLENFISEYTCELAPEFQDNMRYYALALLNHSKKNYGKALENLIKVKYDFFMFKSDVKNLYVRIYYETNQTEQCFSVLETMKRYITSTKDINEFFKQRNHSFIRYSSELLKLKSSGNYKDLDELKFRIKNENVIESRNWLLEMIDIEMKLLKNKK